MLDNGGSLLTSKGLTPTTSAETFISVTIPIYETSYFDYNISDPLYNKSQVPEIIGNRPILANLENGKIYYWYAYLLSNGQRIDSDMQSFIFKQG